MTRVHVLVGTRKGAWIYTSDERREKWEVSEPMLKGWQFYHIDADTRRDPVRLYAAANHWAWGRSVAKSDDWGKNWDWVSEGLTLGETPIQNMYCVRAGHADEPGVVYAGTQPAGLFRSEDWGHTWRPVAGFNDRQYAQYWSGTGGGDSTVHSIELDPRTAGRMYACVSAGGSYVTEDGGDTWELISRYAIPTNPEGRKFTQEIIEQFTPNLPPDVDPLAIDEMHKLVVDHKQPDRLWTQTHVGVFRSDDRGRSWEDVTNDLPSFHGFPIAVTKRAADAAFVFPLEMGPDNFRVAPGQFAIYRTRDAGKHWEPLTNGLPGPNDFQSVYREGMDTDGLEAEGVYVGTTNGAVFYTRDTGDTWHRLPGTLPPILSVSVLVE
jgi:photosystem II stability/assembly factor-like uncharacterized protein